MTVIRTQKKSIIKKIFLASLVPAIVLMVLCLNWYIINRYDSKFIQAFEEMINDCSKSGFTVQYDDISYEGSVFWKRHVIVHDIKIINKGHGSIIGLAVPKLIIKTSVFRDLMNFIDGDVFGIDKLLQGIEQRFNNIEQSVKKDYELKNQDTSNQGISKDTTTNINEDTKDNLYRNFNSLTQSKENVLYISLSDDRSPMRFEIKASNALALEHLIDEIMKNVVRNTNISKVLGIDMLNKIENIADQLKLYANKHDKLNYILKLRVDKKNSAFVTKNSGGFILQLQDLWIEQQKDNILEKIIIHAFDVKESLIEQYRSFKILDLLELHRIKLNDDLKHTPVISDMTLYNLQLKGSNIDFTTTLSLQKNSCIKNTDNSKVRQDKSEVNQDKNKDVNLHQDHKGNQKNNKNENANHIKIGDTKGEDDKSKTDNKTKDNDTSNLRIKLKDDQYNIYSAVVRNVSVDAFTLKIGDFRLELARKFSMFNTQPRTMIYHSKTRDIFPWSHDSEQMQKNNNTFSNIKISDLSVNGEIHKYKEITNRIDQMSINIIKIVEYLFNLDIISQDLRQKIKDILNTQLGEAFEQSIKNKSANSKCYINQDNLKFDGQIYSRLQRQKPQDVCTYYLEDRAKELSSLLEIDNQSKYLCGNEL